LSFRLSSANGWGRAWAARVRCARRTCGAEKVRLKSSLINLRLLASHK
jgi:hypothetical protein